MASVIGGRDAQIAALLLTEAVDKYVKEQKGAVSSAVVWGRIAVNEGFFGWQGLIPEKNEQGLLRLKEFKCRHAETLDLNEIPLMPQYTAKELKSLPKEFRLRGDLPDQLHITLDLVRAVADANIQLYKRRLCVLFANREKPKEKNLTKDRERIEKGEILLDVNALARLVRRKPT